METRQCILGAAERVMRAKGYARATTKAIAQAAGVSEGTLYNYFPGKEALFLAVLGEQLPGFIAFVRALPDRAGSGSVRGNLVDMARVALAFYNESVPVGISVSGEPELLARLRHTVRPRQVGPQKANEMVTEYLRGEQRLGRVRDDVDAAATADLLVGACFQRAYLLHFLGEELVPDQAERFARGIVETLLRGIAPSPSRDVQVI